MNPEPYDSTADTIEHISRVQCMFGHVTVNLTWRAARHDLSKLESPEKDIFDNVGPRLKGLTYGSDEYKASLAELGVALKHHYACNSHHPENKPNGIDGMSLLDVLEMLIDWKAAGERHADGSIERSLTVNKERFAISDQLASILRNTCIELGWIKP